MTGFGFRILDALVVDIEPDYTVKDAMNEQNASETGLLVTRGVTVGQVVVCALRLKRRPKLRRSCW